MVHEKQMLIILQSAPEMYFGPKPFRALYCHVQLEKLSYLEGLYIRNTLTTAVFVYTERRSPQKGMSIVINKIDLW